MRYTSRTATYLAAIWGLMYALFIQRTEIGKTLARRTTWASVVIGVGVDLLIALPLVPSRAWLAITHVVVASSIGIITRSLINEWRDITTVGVINAGYPGQRRA